MNVKRQLQGGFTLIELMIVVAIVGILAAIAIPQYQDYTIRARVSEGVNLASAAKTGVAEFYNTNSSFPSSNSQAGINDTINSTYVSSVTIGASGVISVSFNTATGTSGTIEFSPSAGNGSVNWTCTGGSLETKYRPANCRQ